MGSHVPAVCEQGHGAIHSPGHNLKTHHEQGDPHHHAGVAFGGQVAAVIAMAVCRVHGLETELPAGAQQRGHTERSENRGSHAVYQFDRHAPGNPIA